MTTSQQVGELKWVDYARRSMQRLGYLKWALTLASISRPQSLEAMSRSLANSVTTQAKISEDQRRAFEIYVRTQKLHQRYSEGSTSAELQDIFLSDERVPAHSGALTGDIAKKGYRHSVYVDIPTWGGKLQLLRPQNYTLTDRGRVMMMCSEEGGVTPIGAEQRNPFVLAPQECYVALYCLLEVDGDFIKELYHGFQSSTTFSRSDVGDAAIDALKALKPRLAIGGRQQQMRTKLEKTIDAIANRRSVGMGPRESVATPRTEPLVDCGVLERAAIDAYEYRITALGRSFFSALSRADSVEEFLRSGLLSVFGQVTNRAVGKNAPLDIVYTLYEKLRSGLGYVSTRELTLAAAASTLSRSDGELYEPSCIEGAIRAGSSQGLAKVALGRSGKDSQVWLNLRAKAK